MRDAATELAIKANAEALKLHLFCPNERCGLTGRAFRIGTAIDHADGTMKGVEERNIRSWTVRPEVEATDDPIITMTVPRQRLYCPDCGTRGHCR